jgi:hypothetical protein
MKRKAMMVGLVIGMMNPLPTMTGILTGTHRKNRLRKKKKLKKYKQYLKPNNQESKGQ